MVLNMCKFTAKWFAHIRFFALKRGRKSKRFGDSRASVESSVHFLMWTDARKARNALLTCRLNLQKLRVTICL